MPGVALLPLKEKSLPCWPSILNSPIAKFCERLRLELKPNSNRASRSFSEVKRVSTLLEFRAAALCAILASIRALVADVLFGTSLFEHSPQ